VVRLTALNLLRSTATLRRLRTHYSGRTSPPGYHCSGEHLVEGRGSYCLNIGGVQIDDAVARAFIAALEPAADDALSVGRKISLGRASVRCGGRLLPFNSALGARDRCM
jgi:hypothetical protein